MSEQHLAGLGANSFKLIGTCRCMALSLAPHNIRVNAIGPGSIMTEVLASVAGDVQAMHRCSSFHLRKKHKMVPNITQIQPETL